MENPGWADGAPLEDRVAAVSALSDPARRALYDLVARSAEPVSRDAAAEAVGLGRSTAAFHLDRLAAEGLLEVEYRRLTGRTGPGSGRPAKLYRRANAELNVSVPGRHYELAGDLLASAIEASIETGTPVRAALRVVAGAAGRDVGASVRARCPLPSKAAASSHARTAVTSCSAIARSTGSRKSTPTSSASSISS